MTQVTDHGGGVRSIQVPIPDNPARPHAGIRPRHRPRTGPHRHRLGRPGVLGHPRRGLTACGTGVAEIHGVVITHHHPDHHGLSGQVREASGAWIAMHAADTAIVRRTRDDRAGRWFAYMTAKLTAAGRPRGPHRPPARRPRDRPSDPARSSRRAFPTARSSPANSSTSPAAGCARSGPRATPPATSACTWRRSTRPDLPGQRAASSPATTCCPGSPRTSACTRTPTTRRPPTPSATTSTPWNASAAWPRPRCSPPTSTPSPTRPPAYGNSSTTTRNGSPACAPCSPTPLTPWQLAERMEWNRPWDRDPLRITEHRGLGGGGPPAPTGEAGPRGGGAGQRPGDVHGGVNPVPCTRTDPRCH